MISQIINNSIQSLSPRQREVINGRFGLKLKEGEKATLAALGGKYDITRERVRQIENEALRELKDIIGEDIERKVMGNIKNYLEGLGGARREDFFIQDLRGLLKDDLLHQGHLRLLLRLAERPNYYPADVHLHDFWYLEDEVIKLIKSFAKDLEKIVARRKTEVLEKNQLDVFLKEALRSYKISEAIGMNYISLWRSFGVSPYGDFGLTHWEEIRPRTMRSKAYLILKKEDKPLHFQDIAELINKMNFDNRRAHPATVHNELIKDPRFVLVGRGLYALQEHGFMPGTTKELIIQLLKKQGVLSLNEINDAVLKQRFIKPNTIFLYLQNRKQFKKLPDGK